MAYRSQKFIELVGDREGTVLDMVLDLHCYVTGAGDLENPERIAEALREVIVHWKPGHDRSLLFDTAVYTLIRTVIGEYDEKAK